MFGSDHREHKFDHLEKVYDRHLKEVRTEQDCIKSRLKEYVKSMDELREIIKSVQEAKEEKWDEIDRITKLMQSKLEGQLKEKLMILLAEKNVIGDEISYLESLEESVNKEISSASKSNLVEKSSDLIKTIEEVKNRPGGTFDSSKVTMGFMYEKHV